MGLMIEYRNLRRNNLGIEEFRHLKLLLFWPLFGLLFLYLERFRVVSSYAMMHCALDDSIPFCEYFLISYLFWFVFLAGIHIYTLLYDTETFRKMMHYFIITYAAAVANCVFIVFLKQHSVLDIVVALPIALIAYPLAYGLKIERRAVLKRYST